MSLERCGPVADTSSYRGHASGNFLNQLGGDAEMKKNWQKRSKVIAMLALVLLMLSVSLPSEAIPVWATHSDAGLTYVGKVNNLQGLYGYQYAPEAVVRPSNGSTTFGNFWMYSCSSAAPGDAGDHISFFFSWDAYTWHTPDEIGAGSYIIIHPENVFGSGHHTCDPAPVIVDRIDGTWVYLYVTVSPFSGGADWPKVYLFNCNVLTPTQCSLANGSNPISITNLPTGQDTHNYNLNLQSVIWTGGIYHAWYYYGHASRDVWYNGKHYRGRVYHATSPDGVNFTTVSHDPVIEVIDPNNPSLNDSVEISVRQQSDGTVWAIGGTEIVAPQAYSVYMWQGSNGDYSHFAHYGSSGNSSDFHVRPGFLRSPSGVGNPDGSPPNQCWHIYEGAGTGDPSTWDVGHWVRNLPGIC